MPYVVRVYRGDDNAPPGPDQDQVPAAELQPGRGRAVHRGQGLRQEDVCPGDKSQSEDDPHQYHIFFSGRTILVLEGTASPNPCGDTKESLEILYI